MYMYSTYHVFFFPKFLHFHFAYFGSSICWLGFFLYLNFDYSYTGILNNDKTPIMKSSSSLLSPSPNTIPFPMGTLRTSLFQIILLLLFYFMFLKDTFILLFLDLLILTLPIVFWNMLDKDFNLLVYQTLSLFSSIFKSQLVVKSLVIFYIIMIVLVHLGCFNRIP